MHFMILKIKFFRTYHSRKYYTQMQPFWLLILKVVSSLSLVWGQFFYAKFWKGTLERNQCLQFYWLIDKSESIEFNPIWECVTEHWRERNGLDTDNAHSSSQPGFLNTINLCKHDIHTYSNHCQQPKVFGL